jgi:hypothetical protein
MDYAEPINSVATLAWAGSTKNCVPLIRTGFELQLNQMHILQPDKDFEKRCFDYELFNWLKRLKAGKSSSGK